MIVEQCYITYIFGTLITVKSDRIAIQTNRTGNRTPKV